MKADKIYKAQKIDISPVLVNIIAFKQWVNFMIKKFLSILAAIAFSASSTFAATFEYDIVITDISGEGEAENVGVFISGNVGDLGTGSARTDFDFPATTPTQLIDDSLFTAIFPGVASALSFFANPVAHDPDAGTVTVSGSLGGFTGSGFYSPSAFEFVYQGEPSGTVFTSIADYDGFLSTATMSGFVSAFFIPDSDLDVGFFQRIDFEAHVSEVPVPAGGVLLMSAFGLLALRRRKSL